MKKIKLNIARLNLDKERIANLTAEDLRSIKGGYDSGATPCIPADPAPNTIYPCDTTQVPTYPQGPYGPEPPEESTLISVLPSCPPCLTVTATS